MRVAFRNLKFSFDLDFAFTEEHANAKKDEMDTETNSVNEDKLDTDPDSVKEEKLDTEPDSGKEGDMVTETDSDEEKIVNVKSEKNKSTGTDGKVDESGKNEKAGIYMPFPWVKWKGEGVKRKIMWEKLSQKLHRIVFTPTTKNYKCWLNMGETLRNS